MVFLSRFHTSSLVGGRVCMYVCNAEGDDVALDARACLKRRTAKRAEQIACVVEM